MDHSPSLYISKGVSLFLSRSLSISFCLFISVSLSVSLTICLCLSVSFSLSLSLYLCLCVSVSLSVPPCLCLSVSVSLSLSLCFCLSVSVSLSLSLSFSLSLYLCLCLCLSVSLSLSLCRCLSVSASVSLSLYLCFCLSVFVSVFVSLSLSLSLSLFIFSFSTSSLTFTYRALNSMFEPFWRGMRQGCVFSPDLFNISSEMVLRNIKRHEGVREGGNSINNLVLIADLIEKLQNILTTVTIESQNERLQMNANKTESKTVRKQRGTFKYLGLTKTPDARCDIEMKKGLALSKDTLDELCFHQQKSQNLHQNQNSETLHFMVHPSAWM